MKNPLRYLKFSKIEWVMILFTASSAILDIVTALFIDDGKILGYLLLPIAVLFTAIIQGIWIECLKEITHKG